jgi:hypothetical protein
MSLFKKIVEKLAGGSSASLDKIKVESERRRAAKSSARMPKISADNVEGTVASMLQKRIKSAESSSEQPAVKNDDKPKT